MELILRPNQCAVSISRAKSFEIWPREKATNGDQAPWADSWKRNRTGKSASGIASSSYFIAALVVCLIAPGGASAEDLKPETIAAFDRHVQLTEAQIDSELARHEPFLWIESLPENRREAVYQDLRDGKVVIERLETLDRGNKIDVPGGLIHHWIGTIFVSGATLAQVVAFEQDYDNQLQYFQPDVMRSNILQHNGSDFVVDIRFYKKKIISTVLDTTHEVHYQPVDATREWSRSQPRAAGSGRRRRAPRKLKREGHDNGFCGE